MAFTIERIKSFLAKRRLPQFGHEANKDTYSVSLVLFQLWEHDKHFIFHPLFLKIFFPIIPKTRI
jgi:hypothetical protein